MPLTLVALGVENVPVKLFPKLSLTCRLPLASVVPVQVTTPVLPVPPTDTVPDA